MTQRRIASFISLAIGLAVLGLKFWAYSLTGSQAVFSDAMESIVNVITALLLITTIVYASKPADEDHPYGHGKAEYFSSVLEGGLILFAGVAIIIEAVRSFLANNQLRNLDQGQVIIIGAAVVNLSLGLYLQKVGRNQRSLAFEASGKHLISDFWTSAAVLMALALVKWTQITWIDPLLALGSAGYLCWNGLDLVKRSTNELMDAGDDTLLKQILLIFAKHLSSGIIRIHHTRVMRSGHYHHIDAHVVVPEFWEVIKAHEQTDQFMNAFFKEYSHDGEIHFHMDPCRRAYCKVCDVEPCPVRRDLFEKKIPLTLSELRAPLEPPEFLENRNE